MSLAKFSVKNPVLINLFMLLVFIIGIFTLFIIPKEENPAVDFGNIMITIIYPGVSPAEIETTIINKIEQEISDVANIDNIQSWANESSGTISVTFEPNADIDKAWNDLNAELDKVNDLPEDALDPMIMRINMREVAPICDISISGNFSGNAIREISEDLQDGILDIDHISKVDVFGTREREIRVEADNKKLELYQLAIQDIIDAINSQNFNLPGGVAKSNKSEFLVRMMGEFESLEEIGKLIVTKNDNGNFVRIKDIAVVKDTLEKRAIISKLNSEESVVLYVYKKAEGNVISVIKDVKAYIQNFKSSLPNLSVELRNDVSVDVKSSIGTLGNSGIIGIGLVFICLWLFLGWRNAFFAAIGIPFSFFLTFAIMHFFGLTLNTLSLFALVLVLGMIVDDAIVVIENVHRYMELGLTAKEAAIKGTEEIMWPVISAVATTASAFFPMLLMEGMMGKFMRVFPLVVGIALLASLIESLIVLPSHLADFSKINKRKHRESHFFLRIQTAYKKLLIFALKYRFASVFTIFLLALACIGVLGSGMITFEFFPARFPSTIILQMKLPVGSTIEQTEQSITKVENFIQGMSEKSDIQAMITNIGLIEDNYAWDTKTHNAQIKLDFVERDLMQNTPDDIKNSIRAFVNTIPDIISFKFVLPPDGPPQGKDVEIRIRGDKLNKLESFGNYVVSEIEKIPGIVDVQHDFNIGKKELRISPIQEKMQRYGLNYAMIASTVRSANYGTEVSKFRGEDGQEYEFYVSYDKTYIENLNSLKNLKIRSQYGTLISLNDVADFSIERGLSRIVHYDKKRTITITANTSMFLDKENGRMTKLTPDQANKIFFGSFTRKGIFTDFNEKHPGYTMSSGGTAEEQRKSYGSLYLAFIVALILIYSILASQFRSYVQPLIVMTTVPFAFIGVIFGLLVTNLPFSLTTLVAFVALAGVVVNDSLVLVDFVNSLRDKGLDRWSSLIEAGATRLRPIILTTITTISGLMPMILSNSKTTEDWKPMAVSIVFGLSFATILTLIVIPCIYSIVDSFFGLIGITRFKDHVKLKDVIKKID